jgi:hypothetical protein
MAISPLKALAIECFKKGIGGEIKVSGGDFSPESVGNTLLQKRYRWRN